MLYYIERFVSSQDLTKYKYNKLITKALNILNKIYSSKSNMFQISFKAQVFVYSSNCLCFIFVTKIGPVLRRVLYIILEITK